MKWEPDYEEQVRTLKRTDFPAAVLVETTAHCNYKCSMCPQKSLKRKKGEMSFDIFRKIVDEIAVESPSTRLWLAIMGEALLLGDKLVKMIRYAKQKGLQSVHLNTNASLLDERIARNLVISGLDEIVVGLDAFSEETYKKIRIGGDFNTVCCNVENLIKIKREKRSITPRIVMQFILMGENEGELEDFKNYWLSQGAIVKIRAKISWGSVIPAEHLSLTNAERTFPCPMLIRHCAIHWDGHVANCSDADFECRYSAGDIRKSTIKEIWNGELAERREKQWNMDFSHELCKDCKDWQMGLSLFYYPSE